MAIGQADSYNETLVRENEALRKEIEELINSRRKGKARRYRDDDESEGEGRQIKRHRTVAHSSEEDDEDDEDVDDEARVSKLTLILTDF